ncbi:glycosyltransferase [Rufibacter sp. DG15C]|uniref:glycosyltransferase n=1 Tax=Rufibacter sp. DG15C TaxID=1379909 RepID=UPI00078CFF9B|nr:glycosyltransferase [Rufibacter sp. DG15C]AMM52147.1 glycosyltransferase [Rufibacter sp. DG15C]
MFRKRILLASLLKPVNDTRMYAKLGLSLTKLAAAEVHIVGFTATVPEQSPITFHPIFNFKRISWGRLAAQWSFWKLLKQVNPEVLVVCTHELLPLAWFYKKRHGGKLVYDIQENYQLNLETQLVYGSVMGKLLGKLVRFVETLIAPQVDHFLLAEASYAQELPFIENRGTILQNKYKAPASVIQFERQIPVHLHEAAPLKLLYSGTLSELYGVLQAISFAEQIHTINPSTSLTIIGYAPDTGFLEKVRARIKDLAYIQLIGGDHLVPHSQILQMERNCQVGLMPYQPHPSTFGCVPTKLFEYLANGLVIIAQQNRLWQNILQEKDAGVCLDFTAPISKENIEEILNRTYYSLGLPKDVYWETEEVELTIIFQNLLQ